MWLNGGKHNGKRTISDYTEAGFLAFVAKVCTADYPTDSEHTQAVLEFERLTEHPEKMD